MFVCCCVILRHCKYIWRCKFVNAGVDCCWTPENCQLIVLFDRSVRFFLKCHFATVVPHLSSLCLVGTSNPELSNSSASNLPTVDSNSKNSSPTNSLSCGYFARLLEPSSNHTFLSTRVTIHLDLTHTRATRHPSLSTLRPPTPTT
ncbi:hypothetical protein L1887_05415 [Cichorium endivia]|nr:hypothetical protein L1887_05415 [Cichorium endivia]